MAGMRAAMEIAAAMPADLDIEQIEPKPNPSDEELLQYIKDASGTSFHFAGTARMGRDPATSVLNGRNQAHDIANLFITDGSCMASIGSVNPSLTYMALSARAAHHAADLLASGEI